MMILCANMAYHLVLVKFMNTSIFNSSCDLGHARDEHSYQQVLRSWNCSPVFFVQNFHLTALAAHNKYEVIIVDIQCQIINKNQFS